MFWQHMHPHLHKTNAASGSQSVFWRHSRAGHRQFVSGASVTYEMCSWRSALCFGPLQNLLLFITRIWNVGVTPLMVIACWNQWAKTRSRSCHISGSEWALADLIQTVDISTQSQLNIRLDHESGQIFSTATTSRAWWKEITYQLAEQIKQSIKESIKKSYNIYTIRKSF